MPIYHLEAGDPSCAQVYYVECDEELTQKELDTRWSRLLAYAAMRLYKRHDVYVGPHAAALELSAPACARVWAQSGFRLLHARGASRAYGLGTFDDPDHEGSAVFEAVSAGVREEIARLNIRFVLTILGETEDYRVLFDKAQGRFTYTTHAEANAHRRALLANSEERLREIFGDRLDSLEVQPVMCWPGHNDPQVTVLPLFGEDLNEDEDSDADI